MHLVILREHSFLKSSAAFQSEENRCGIFHKQYKFFYKHRQSFFLRNSASSFHWLSSSIFTVRLFVVWCFRPYKPYIFCEDMILATYPEFIAELSPVYCCLVLPMVGVWCFSSDYWASVMFSEYDVFSWPGSSLPTLGCCYWLTKCHFKMSTQKHSNVCDVFFVWL